MMRWSRQLHTFIQESWLGYTAALAAVALVSVVIWVVVGRTHLANISMLYLGAVLATAVCFGRGPAVLASVAAFLTFDFFFTVPYYTFTVADPEEWVALLFFSLRLQSLDSWQQTSAGVPKRPHSVSVRQSSCTMWSG